MAGASNDCSPDPDVQLWLSNTPGDSPDTVPAWLHGHEQRRALGYRHASRADFIHSRWLIRQALAQVSGQAAEDCWPVPDRPVASCSPPGWTLSLSHSHGLVACATSAFDGVGVDIEPSGRHGQWQKVVRRWFTPREQAWLLRTDSVEEFLRCWTLKEAWLKATGRGIAGNLQTLEIDANGTLQGDRPETDWLASSGTFMGFHIALVYRGHPHHSPRSSLLEAPSGFQSLQADRHSGDAVHWHRHEPIAPQVPHPSTEQDLPAHD